MNGWGLGLMIGAALSAGACFGALAMAVVAAGKRANDERVRAYLLAVCQLEVPLLADMAAMVDPIATEEVMTAVYAAIAMAKQDD